MSLVLASHYCELVPAKTRRSLQSQRGNRTAAGWRQSVVFEFAVVAGAIALTSLNIQRRRGFIPLPIRPRIACTH